MAVLIEKLLQTVVSREASDLHISVGQPPVLRLHGRMRKLETEPLTPDDTVQLMKSISPERNQQELQEIGGSDFGFAFGNPPKARFRVSIFKQRGHVGMVLRQIPTKFLSMEDLGLPPKCKELIMRPRGLFLVTGPTGSGKSTSLASMVNFINETADHHIITIEDPIEFYHEHKTSTVNQREVGVDVPSFSEAIKRALRQDPDVILVGEMRDLETIEAAISAAETGHVVFGTLHTNSAEATVNRIIDVFPETQQAQIRTQLSMSLIGVLSQTLLPKKGGGRIAAHELLVITPAIANLMRENKIYQMVGMMQTGKKQGMQLMDDKMFELWRDGICEEKEVLLKSQRPAQLASRILTYKETQQDDDEEEDD